MKQFFSLLLVIASLTGFSQEVNLDKVRSLYFSMDTDLSAVLKLSRLLDAKKQTSETVLMAYRGASSAASAGVVDGVQNKFSCFSKGKTDLEQAVRLNPENPEIRFLRLATQTNTPGFLFYKMNIREDKKIVLEGLPRLLSSEEDHSLALNMARFLLKFDSLTGREKQLVNQLRLRYERNN